MDRWKSRWEESEKRRVQEERRSEKRKSQKKEDAGARKGRKVAIHCVFPMIRGSGGSKSRLAKAAGAEPSGKMRDEKLHAVVARSTKSSFGALLEVEMLKKCTQLWREEHVEVKMYNTHTHTMFGPLLEVEMWKSARRCGAKQISKSKGTKHTMLGALLEVEMSKKCTPLWREAHFQVKMYKTHQLRSAFGSWDVEKVHAVVARSTFPSQNVKNTTCSDHFWRCRCGFAWRAQGILHLAKSEQNVRILWHLQKWWQAWGICRGSAKMHFVWQAQYKRHVHQRC